jgi:hypothetical protein
MLLSARVLSLVLLVSVSLGVARNLKVVCVPACACVRVLPTSLNAELCWRADRLVLAASTVRTHTECLENKCEHGLRAYGTCRTPYRQKQQNDLYTPEFADLPPADHDVESYLSRRHGERNASVSVHSRC